MSLIRSLITDVPDWPKPGVVFKDITPLLASPEGFAQAIDAIAASAPSDIDFVVGMEARGFIFAAPVALRLGAGFVPVRKPGKLPREVVSESFALEYGTATLRCMWTRCSQAPGCSSWTMSWPPEEPWLPRQPCCD